MDKKDQKLTLEQALAYADLDPRPAAQWAHVAKDVARWQEKLKDLFPDKKR